MSKNIAIIGGGLTGLVAAYRLMEKDYHVTIYEKSGELGGLASGFIMHGTNIEKTYHHIFKSDTDIIKLVEELGLEDKLEWNNSSVSIYYQNKIYPFGTPKTLLTFKPLNIIDRVRTGAAMFFLMKSNNWKSLIKIPAYKWMLKFAGKNSYKVIWEPLLKGKFDTFYDQVSMAWLWARIHIRANSQEKGGEKLGYFKDGFNVIIKKLEDILRENHVEIILNADIESISRTDVRPNVPTIIINGEEKEYDAVIATVPSHVFAHLITPVGAGLSRPGDEKMSDYLTQLNSINYIGAVVAVFSSEQDLGDYYWNNINDLEMPFLAFINHTKLISKERYEGKNIYYIGKYLPHDHKYFSMSNDEVYAVWFTALKKIFPEFDESKVLEKHMFKLKNAQHIVDLDYEKKIPAFETPLKNVFLSNFSQIFPEDRGTNYAVRDGSRIAELVNQNLSV